ncbi:MAG: L,D-transpeptidase [Acidimicrobiales bacterium]
MRFQSDHNLPTTGANSPASWHAIVAAVIEKHFDPTNYSYVLVSQRVPQQLKLYINGRVVFTSAVNTGIPASPTQNGTYPVYLRYTTTTMSGTNPNGTKYHDTGIPWVSYFHGGDALHGFLRSQYGYPQSLGCVEMTFAHAAVVWPHTPIGTLVTVQ